MGKQSCTVSRMASKTTEPKAEAKTEPKAVYSNTQILEAATGKWGEIAQDVKPAEALIIAVPESEHTITITPLTRRRRKALKASQATYLMMGSQLAEVGRTGDANQATLSRIQGLIEKSEEAYDRALFGDVYDEVVEYFEDLDEVWWDAMYQGVHDQLVNRVEAPETVCSKCGQEIEQNIDEESGEGKDESSSTSSTDTGPKLRAISTTTSE